MRWRILLATLVLAAPLAACGADRQPGEDQAVVLIHGLGRTERSMMILGQRLAWAGYDVETVGYPSRTGTIDEHVDALAAAVASCCAESTRIHFVGHSLGGIIIRKYLAERPPDALGRVVLLSPPSRGSELADWVVALELGDREFGEELLGPTGSGLGKDSTDIPPSLPPPTYDVGIITGNRSLNPVGSIVIPGPDDGMVGVDEARIEGVPSMVLPRSHTFIMNSRFTADAVLRFLETGQFEE